MTTTPYKPIGYYLKALDALIDEHFARSLSAHELTRRDWQVLNSLALQGPLTRQTLGRLLGPFWEPGARTLDEVVHALADRGRITADGDTLALTTAGRRAHAEAASWSTSAAPVCCAGSPRTTTSVPSPSSTG